MNDEEKLVMVQTLLGVADSETAEIERIEVYLTAAEKEILTWRYSLSGNQPTEFPEEFDMVQVWAVVYGYSQAGAEGQSTHSENGVSRTFNYADMNQYIHRNVRPLVGVLSR